jgi:hypothetical protein
MQGALNCVENWCIEVDLSANRSDNNNRKIWGFYNPRLFGTELRMTDQVIGGRILKIGCAKLALHIGCVVVGMTCGLSPNVVAGLKSGAEKS